MCYNTPFIFSTHVTVLEHAISKGNLSVRPSLKIVSRALKYFSHGMIEWCFYHVGQKNCTKLFFK